MILKNIQECTTKKQRFRKNIDLLIYNQLKDMKKYMEHFN